MSKITVTKPFLPPIELYSNLLNKIWDNNWLTNNGPVLKELESKLKSYLGIDNLIYVSNGTIAIQVGIKALDLKGEIITTPFSYVATCSSIVWENCKPKFVDIDPLTWNINPSKIEDAIGPNTCGIVATHVFGNPCDVECIEEVSKKYKLPVIYDAAHAFGTKYKNKSLFSYGDISTASFHATKLFHTVEGGAIFTKNLDTLKKCTYMRNFGHKSPEEFHGLGINAKNSEFHAAMGLVNMNYINDILIKRKDQYLTYLNLLDNHESFQFQKIFKNTEYNYSYFPMLFENEKVLMKVKEGLENKNIGTRRYFYPSLNDLPYVEKEWLKEAESISSRVLCLPLFHDLKFSEIENISKLVIKIV